MTKAVINDKDVDITAAPKQAPSSSLMSVSNDLANPVHDIFYTEHLIQNHSNFKRSGSSARFMHYEGGFWVNFADELVDSLRAGLLDHRSVAWIDVHDKCFFPKTFIDGGGEPSSYFFY
ncbi:hypothetical protein U1Q18_016453 [Sarracenia purpurea var. burkii]